MVVVGLAWLGMLVSVSGDGEFWGGRGRTVAVAQEAKPVADGKPAVGDAATPALAAALVVEQAVVEAIGAAEKSVVAIARQKRGKPRTMEERLNDDRLVPLTDRTPDDPDFVPNEYGTGVIFDRAGFIVTNYHVVGDPKLNRVWVWVNKRPFPAEVKAADPWLDLAVLKIEAEKLEPIRWGDAKSVRRGQLVVSLGNPYAIARDGQPSASWGIVSNLARKAAGPERLRGGATGGGETLHQYGTLIQTDCRLQLGTSGGALINLRGEMIGLTTALAALEGDDAAAGFAIPVDDAFKNALDALKAGRKAEYGFLGIGPELLGLNQRQQGQFGTRVRQIIPGTPAARSELQENDIVTQVGDVVIADPAELIREVSRLPAEANVVLTVRRADGKQSRTVAVPVRLSKKYVAGPPYPYAETVDPSWRGLRVDFATATPQFAVRGRDLDPEGAVGVLDVEKDSAAWRAGIRPGDFISHLGDQRVNRPADFYERAQAATGEVSLRVAGAADRDARKTVAAE